MNVATITPRTILTICMSKRPERFMGRGVSVAEGAKAVHRYRPMYQPFARIKKGCVPGPLFEVDVIRDWPQLSEAVVRSSQLFGAVVKPPPIKGSHHNHKSRPVYQCHAASFLGSLKYAHSERDRSQS